jgi:hypothetical protein
MSIYYVVKLYTADPRSAPDYLGPRQDLRGETSQLGVCNVMEAKRFLWKEEAFRALKEFMDDFGGDRIVRGQVFCVKEEAVTDHEVGETPVRAPALPSAPLEAPPGPSNPFLEQAEEILAAGEACDLGDDTDHDAYHEAALWFYENARTFLDAVRERDEVVRERDRLDWLRKHPESCRAQKDCRNLRAPGYIHCAECLKDPSAGGYFDVYQRHYATYYNALLDLDERLGTKLDAFRLILECMASGANLPSEPDPKAP